MRVLVTGGAGFIGSHFIREWLRTHPKDQIVTLDALTYAGSLERLADLPPARHQWLKGDVADRADVARAMAGCAMVVHFAAETHVDRSITDAAPFLRTNVDGTLALLQASAIPTVSRLLHISTDEVYGPVLSGAVDEQAPLAPHSPYAASKASGDLLVQAFHRTYGQPVVIARPTNIYGPGQFPEKFIPLCITNALDGRSIPVYGDGQHRRAWLHVDDACAAIERILERGALGEIYNIAGGTEAANVDTARKVLGVLGRTPELLSFVDDRPGHDRRYAMQDAKLRALGWSPATPFEQGLAATVAWYREHVEWWRPLANKLREDSYHWLHRPAGPSAHQDTRLPR